MALEDILSGAAGLANTVYNFYTNKRDFDYQKALQQTMFEREDTAVQRRMADLQAAGINPNIAAGSAASAGSVVSRSNTNDVNMGTALDMVQALNNINIDPKQIARIEAIVLSMTPKERRNPDIIKASRKTRIAMGCGASVQEVNKLLTQFEQMKKMMKQISNGNMKLPF